MIKLRSEINVQRDQDVSLYLNETIANSNLKCNT